MTALEAAQTRLRQPPAPRDREAANVLALCRQQFSTTLSSATSPQAAKSTNQRYLNCLARGTPPAPSRFVATTASNTTCARSGEGWRARAPLRVFFDGGVRRGFRLRSDSSRGRRPPGHPPGRRRCRRGRGQRAGRPCPAASRRTCRPNRRTPSPTPRGGGGGGGGAAATLFPSAASRALDFESSGGRMSKRDEGSSRAVDALRGLRGRFARRASPRDAALRGDERARPSGRSGSAEARSRCAGSATTATFTRTSFVTENASCDKTNNGGRGEGIARARGFGPGDGGRATGRGERKRSAHLRGLRTMWSARCAAFDALCGTRPALSFQVSAKVGARVGRGERTRDAPFSQRRLRSGLSVPTTGFFFFWFSQSDLFKDKPAGETLAGVSGRDRRRGLRSRR